MRRWLPSLLVGPLLVFVACDDDGNSNAAAGDAGSDAGTSTPYVPQPLLCTSAGMFDPCGVATDPTVFAAVAIADAGARDADAGVADAGSAITGCIATGAVRVTCPDEQTKFDLAAGANGGSIAVAYGANASRFEIAKDGALSPMTAIQGDSQVTVLSGAAGVALLTAGNKSARVARDGFPAGRSAGYLQFTSELDGYTPIGGAGMQGDGTIVALFRGGEDNGFWTIPVDYDGQTNRTSPQKGATALWVGSTSIATAGSKGSGGAVSINGVEAPGSFAKVFAAGPSPVPGHALAAGLAGDVIDVFASRSADAPDFVRMRIEREPPCAPSSCGGICTETNRRVALDNAPGTFVKLDNGNVYFVYGEVTVTRERQTTSDRNIGCDIFGGCGCRSTFEYKSAGDVDAVVMQVVAEPYQLVERTRVRLALTHPATSLLEGNGHLKAVARGNQIQALLFGNGGEMARVLLDVP